MTLPRLPITVWAWFINAILSLLIFSILLAACVYLLADRILGTHIFSAAAFLSRLSHSVPSSRIARSLAAPVLVFCAGASLRRHPAVLRHRHASDLDILAQARLGPSRRRACALCRRPLRLLHLGTAHLRERSESLFTARFLSAGLFAGSARVDSADELVRHSLERQGPADDGDALRSRFRLALSCGRSFRTVPRAQRSHLRRRSATTSSPVTSTW